MVYFLLILALALVCMAGLLFFYMMFLQAVSRHDKRRIEELEKELRKMQGELDRTAHELETAEQNLAQSLAEHRNDAWPEIIDG